MKYVYMLQANHIPTGIILVVLSTSRSGMANITESNLHIQRNLLPGSSLDTLLLLTMIKLKNLKHI